MFKKLDVVVWQNPKDGSPSSLDVAFKLYKVLEVDEKNITVRELCVRKEKSILCNMRVLVFGVTGPTLPHLKPLAKLTKEELVKCAECVFETCDISSRATKSFLVETITSKFLGLYNKCVEEDEKEKEEATAPLKVTAALLGAISSLPKGKSWVPSCEQELVLQAIGSDKRSSSTYWGEEEGVTELEKKAYMKELEELGFRVEDKGMKVCFSW